ncbi:MAG: hypothetical protein JST87_05215 [Bacteroidetes bacterium]|nr:hypothetical protein [Bacteroidota bacterium]
MKRILISNILFLFFLSARSQTDTLQSLGYSMPLGNTKTSAMVCLKGKAIVDARSASKITYKWFAKTKAAKSKIIIETPTALITRVRGLIPGSYQFGFVVKDNRIKKSDTAYTNVTITN